MQQQDLPIDPCTGLQALAILPSGRVVWPIVGGDGTDGDGGAGSGDGDGDGDEGGKPADPAAEVAKWKALARKHEGEAKKGKDAAKRLAELEDADKSEIQRERDKAAAAEARANAAETRADRLEIAAEKGLSPKLAARLVGATREELEADADELLAQLKGDGKGDDAGKPPAGSPARPKESLRSGSAPDAEPEENDPKKLADLIPRS